MILKRGKLDVSDFSVMGKLIQKSLASNVTLSNIVYPWGMLTCIVVKFDCLSCVY